MPAIGRKLAIARRRERIEELIGQGFRSSYTIAAELVRQGIPANARTIQRDIQALEAEWRERNADKRDIYKMLLVRQATMRNERLWAAWERSKQLPDQLADPKYIREMLENDKFIARVLGLYPGK